MAQVLFVLLLIAPCTLDSGNWFVSVAGAVVTIISLVGLLYLSRKERYE